MINCVFENGNKASLRHVTVDTLVFKDGKILLAKRVNKLLEGGKWGLIGGFVERNENLEEAVKREVLEETGWEVKGVKLLRIKDSPNRPHEDRQNISFVYTCIAFKKLGEGDWESTDLKWFDLEGIPEKENVAFDHFDDIQFYMETL